MLHYDYMKLPSKKYKKYLGALFFGLLIFATGHSFFLPQTAFAFVEATPAHHDLAPHETEADHFACPTDLHQLSYSRDQYHQQDLSDAPIADTSTDHWSGELSFYTPLILDRQDPYIGIPFDQKIVLLL